MGLSIRTPRWAFSLWLIVGGVGLIAIFGGTALSRATLELSGTIVSATYIKDPSGPHRFTERYVIDPGGGRPLETYDAVGNDGSLSQDLREGSQLEKRQWQLDYEVDGRTIKDFPATAYVVFVSFGFLGVASGICLLLRKPEPSSAKTEADHAVEEFLARDRRE